ncbi:hypothetical protein MYCO108962_10980 [Mycobacterium colombiense]
MTGSTFSAIEVIVWNSVLISVVTDRASITVCDEIRCGDGLAGDVNDTYLPPNTVVALISAFTFDGISLRYRGYTSNVNFAAGFPSRTVSAIDPTRPISTPL